MKSKFLNKCKSALVHAFGKYLLVTNVVSGGALMGIGDSIEQLMELKRHHHPSGQYDWKRLRDMVTVGFLSGGPQHFFYSRLDKYLPGQDKKTIVKKIIFDQIVVSPVILIIFFHGLGFLQTGTLSAGFEELKSKIVTIYMIDCMFWPPVQAINFSFLSPKHRVMYVNFMTMLYDIILSHIKYSVEHEEHEK